METRNSFFSNFIWRFLERTGAQVVTFIVSIVLARILSPDIYGVVALATVFTTILQVFVDSGMGNALVQKKDADDLDFSTVFYFNVVFGLVLYALIYLISPFISRFYGIYELTAIVRVLGLIVIIAGFKNVEQAYVSKNLLFKKFFFATLVGTIAAAIVGILLAVKGYGAWALVGQLLVNQLIDTIVLWIVVDWRPKLIFSFDRLKSLFSYGWKLLVSALIETIYSRLRTLIIGKYYTKSDLAFFEKGEQFPHAIATNVNSSIDSVLFPIMSFEQDDRDRIRAMTRRSIKVSTYIMMPFMVGLAVCSESLVEVVLSEKWLPCVPFLRILCITYAFYPVHTANLNAIKAIGRSDIFLILEIIKKVVGLIVLFSVMHKGVMVMAYSMLLLELMGQIINTWPNKKLLNYSYFSQIKDMIPQMFISLIMGVVVYCVSFINVNIIITLVLQIIVGIVSYVCLSKIFKVDSFDYLLGIIKNIRNSRQK